MIKVGKEYAPVSAKITKGGKYTQLTLGQQHRVGNKYWNDGFINVLVKGEINWVRGDVIKINEITAATLVSWKGKQYFSIYADVDYIPLLESKAGAFKQTLEDDIPDELL